MNETLRAIVLDYADLHQQNRRLRLSLEAAEAEAARLRDQLAEAEDMIRRQTRLLEARAYASEKARTEA